ncbi:CAF17-like 4Fe-4S cluster assembly/insertion protein YgfZ [Sphingomonas sp. AX6]|uniref:CAF17-like 4Fe-4S cluster assembly/insertion protein YgfZ n=1 Tax=Sphingomonas sp. AX6 TaxID=2653171 RepID=UPI0012F2645E|nr:folate-binding protein [Sphingomonas sp. AX6]VXC68571.1 Aminomethyltransferase [Sphingomonas sp. AX6]
MTDTTPGTWLADRALIRVSGDDIRGFLQGLVTQDVRRVAPDAPQWSGLLTAQGKALFDFLLWDDGNAILIDCEAAQRDALIRRLSIYRLRRPISIEAVEGGVHWSRSDNRGVPDPRLPALGNRWLAEPGEPATDWRAHRLSLGVTEGADELGQDLTLWLEANARELNGTAFDKGCFIGQENTARMHYRGKVNRRLIVAPIAEAEPKIRVAYPDLGEMVALRRIEALGDALVPYWIQAALDAQSTD